MSQTLTRRTLARRSIHRTVPLPGTPSRGATGVSAGSPVDPPVAPPVDAPVGPSPDATPVRRAAVRSVPTDPGADRVPADALDPEAGMATAEYAIATVAAAGFAGLLVVILRSAEVRELLLGIVRSALSV